MQIDDPIDNPTEAIMSDTPTTTLRYGYQPSAAFAATRAGAARRAREAAAASVRPGRATGVLHRLSTIAGGGKTLHVGARRCGDLLPGDVGLAQRLPQDPCVDQQHLDAARPDPVAHERILAPLRVQRPDQDDGRTPLGCLARRRSSRAAVGAPGLTGQA